MSLKSLLLSAWYSASKSAPAASFPHQDMSLDVAAISSYYAEQPPAYYKTGRLVRGKLLVQTFGYWYHPSMAQAHTAHTSPSHSGSPGVPIEEYLAIGADQAAEVIDGELIMMSPQKLKNSRIAHDLVFSIEAFIHGKNPGRVFTEVTFAPDIDNRKRRVRGAVVPDVLYISREHYDEQLNKYGEQDFLRIAPDIVIEVVSEDDKYTLLNRRIELYLRYGTQLVWVIDPQQGNARVITPDQPAGQIAGPDATLSGEPVLPGWSIRLKELLGAQG